MTAGVSAVPGTQPREDLNDDNDGSCQRISPLARTLEDLQKGFWLYNMDKADCQRSHALAKVKPMTTSRNETPSSLEDTPPTPSRPDKVSIVP